MPTVTTLFPTQNVEPTPEPVKRMKLPVNSTVSENQQVQTVRSIKNIPEEAFKMREQG